MTLAARCISLGVVMALLPGTPVLAEQVLYALGDTGDCGPGTRQVAEALRARPDMPAAPLVLLGDLAYPSATAERLAECHQPHFSGFPRRYAVPGNHDREDPDARGFFRLHPEPLPRQVAIGPDWRLVLLDSTLGGDAARAQLRWLQNARSEVVGQCVIAAWHHPRWSSGRHGDSARVDPLWQAINGIASLTLHGHDHHFEALPPLDPDGWPDTGGTASFVVGTGGAGHYPAPISRHASQIVTATWGFLRLELGPRDYRWQMIATTGEIRASGQGRCRPVPRDGSG